MVERLARPTHEHEAVTHALERVMAMQQPFYESMLHQMQAVERRLTDQGNEIKDQGAIITAVKEDVALIVNQQLLIKLDQQDKRLDALEHAETIRQGVALAANIAPKVLVALVVIVALILAYLKIPNPIPKVG
jgi:hypothetical protein